MKKAARVPFFKSIDESTWEIKGPLKGSGTVAWRSDHSRQEKHINRNWSIEALFEILACAEEQDYIGEGVSQLDHALQAASLARQFGGSDSAVFAALFHDIGHLCAAPEAPEMDGLGVLNHEEIGADVLRQAGFQEPIPSLVEGHVMAKRYLAWKHPDYLPKLSDASRGTLQHQGGAMTESEARLFEARSLYRETLQLRFWDESAKDPNAQVPGLDHYRMLLETASDDVFIAP